MSTARGAGVCPTMQGSGNPEKGGSPRLIRSSTLLLPLCAGMWTCLQTLGREATTWRRSAAVRNPAVLTRQCDTTRGGLIAGVG